WIEGIVRAELLELLQRGGLCLRRAGREVVAREPLAREGWWQRREVLCRRGAVAGEHRRGHLPILDGEERFARYAIEEPDVACFRDLCDRVDGAPVAPNGDDHRRGR